MSGHGLAEFGPDFFSISYVQGRPMSRARAIPEVVARLAEAGFRKRELDHFFSSHVGIRGHVARIVLDDVRLSMAGEEGDDQPFQARGSLHVLLWSVGFMVMRLTFTDAGMRRPAKEFRTWFKQMHGLEHELSPGTASYHGSTWSATMGTASIEIAGSVRRFFDGVGAAMHEVLHGRRPETRAVAAWAADSDAAREHAESLVSSGELRYPNPVTFGTHSELIWSSADALPRDPGSWIPQLFGSGAEGPLIATNVDESLPGRWWFLSEFQSIIADVSSSAPQGPEVLDATRAEMVEYLTYRRAGLNAIQLESASLAAERRPVDGTRVADWMWLMSALTNDYVLAGWSGTMFARLRYRLTAFEGVRNLFGLEDQVKSNIAAFQGRLDAESSRIGVITGVLFGIVAATALVPLGELLVIYAFGLGRNAYANFPQDYPAAFVAVVIGMLGLVGGLSWLLLRQSRLLRPPRVDRPRHLFRRARRGQQRHVAEPAPEPLGLEPGDAA